MEYFFSSLKLPTGLNNYVNQEDETINKIEDLSKINIFIGANNSGKSRFLRELAKIENPQFHTLDPDTKKYLQYIQELDAGLSVIKSQEGKGIISFSIPDRGTYNQERFVTMKPVDFFQFGLEFGDLIKKINDFSSPGQYQLSTSQGGVDMLRFQRAIQQFIADNNEKIEFIKSFKLPKEDYVRYYFPILRSLNNFHKEIGRDSKDETIDFLNQRIVNVYKFNLEDKGLDVFTGQRLYYTIRDMLLGDHEDRKKITQYEKFLSKEIFNKEVSLIPKVKSDVINVKIGDDERPIYELGDGIQTLIMLTFPIFTTEKGIFFIEEPETHLHPGMQRKLLELISDGKNNFLNDKKHQYFLTTHSNHFLDLTFDYKDISIYKFSSTEDDGKFKKVELVNSGDESILREIGAKKSSIFITNATIWVEGITDRLYIKKFLELYQNKKDIKRIFEDIDYSFVEYGGSNITHWSFLDSPTPSICVDRLCGKSFVITDRDENKDKRHDKIKAKLGKERYKRLDCREIENILSLKSIEKAIKKFPNDTSFVLPASAIGEDYKRELLGSFIDKKLKPRNKYASKSGTINRKLEFCQNVIEDLTYDELTRSATNLAKVVYNFIVEQNR